MQPVAISAEELGIEGLRDRVLPVRVLTHTLPDGTPAHSFRTLLEDLGTIVRNTCVTRSAKTPAPAFPMVTIANATQQRALQMLQRITV